MPFLKYHSRPSSLGSDGTTAAARQTCLFDSHGKCFGVCVCASLGSYQVDYSSRNQQQCLEGRCVFSFVLLFFAAFSAVAVYLYHRKICTLWQPLCNSSRRTPRSSFCDSYERLFCMCVRARVCVSHAELKADDSNSHFLRNSKDHRSTSTTGTTAVAATAAVTAANLV